MSFLQPILLIGLPLALLPVIIHLINQHRHRTVRWAAMMFLLDAKKMTKGLARLRQILILAMRVLAVAALVFAASRPLAGGWAGFGGGKADTILVLLDRSSSMEQRNLETGDSKRSTALSRIAELIGKTGSGSEIILIDSATLTPTPLGNAAALLDLPATAATATASDIPTMLQIAVDFLATSESGRTDIWLASDLRQGSWNPGSGQWETLRSDLAARETVRLFFLNFPAAESSNTSVSVSGVKRQKGPDGMRLLMDLKFRRQGPGVETDRQVIPVEFTLNGTRTVETFEINGPEMSRLGHSLPLGSGNERGWGRIDLPADENPSDNHAFFVFDEPAVRKTVIVSDDAATAGAIRTAAQSGPDSGVKYETEIFAPANTAGIPWEETALLFWQAALPAPDTTLYTLLRQHVQSGRELILLPPPGDGGSEFFGVKWGDWSAGGDAPLPVKWWRTESGLLGNIRSGDPLPVSDLAIFRTRIFTGETQSLLKLENEVSVIARILTDPVENESDATSSFYTWGTLPKSDHSNLATEGIVFFVMIHRALEEGANAVSSARFLDAGRNALSGFPEIKPLSLAEERDDLLEPGLAAGAYESTDPGGRKRLVALNRPNLEDDTRLLDPQAVETLLAGIDFRQINDEVGSGASLAAEAWRTFLIVMALALIIEAALCLPPKPDGQRNPIRSTT